MKCVHCFFALWGLLFTISPGTSQAATLSPIADDFVYQFLPSFSLHAGPFAPYLSAGNTGIGHDTQSLLKFDVSGLGLSAAEVVSAQLKLFAIDTQATGFGQSPTPATPIQLDLSAAASSWPVDGSVNWNTRALPTGILVTTMQDGINKFITFDLTNLVKDWLNGVENNGVVISQHASVLLNPNDATSLEAGVYNSSRAGNGPQLIVTPVPEPSTCVLALLAGGLAGALGIYRNTMRRQELTGR